MVFETIVKDKKATLALTYLPVTFYPFKKKKPIPPLEENDHCNDKSINIIIYLDFAFDILSNQDRLNIY